MISTSKTALRAAVAVSLIVGAALGGFAAWWFYKPEAPATRLMSEADYIRATTDAVRSRFDDPRSVQFRNVRLLGGADTFIVCGEFTVSKAAGPEVGWNRFLGLRDGIAVEGQIDGFEALFARVCR